MSTASATGSASWTAGTNTFAWTASSYAFMAVPGGSFSGDLSAYTTIGLTVSNVENAFRVDILANNKTFTGKSIAGNGNIVLDILNDFNLQFAADKITVEDLKTVTAIRLNTNSASGSAVVTNFYIEKPTTLDFDATGKAVIEKGDLVATGGLSYNEGTGVLTSDGTAGTLELILSSPVDLRNLKHFNVVRSGDDDIVNRLRFYDEDNSLINTWNSIKWSNTWNPSGIDDNATNAFINNKPVKKLVWESDAAAAKKEMSLTISSVEFMLKTMSCAKAGETQLKSLPWNKIDGSGTATPDWNMNGTSDTYYGNYSGDPTHYADLTAYSELRIYCKSSSDGFRAFFINADKSATIQKNTSVATWHETEKYYSLDLSTIVKWGDKVALKSIKADNDGVHTGRNITNIVVYNTPAANAPQYTLTGCGMPLAETVAALADASATCIDATGVTGITTNSVAGRTLLTSANPNCLFLGTTGNGALANTKNVITSGTCANLELTDGKPFKASGDFTATAAPTYNRTFTADKTTTVCLPFALTEEEAYSLGTFYEFDSVEGSTMNFTSVAAPEANKPYLVTTTAGSLSLSETGKSIAATPVSLVTTKSDIEFIGTLEATTIPASGAEYSYFAYNDGSLVKIVTNAATLPAFRAYFKVPTSVVSGARIAARFIGGSVTGIGEVSEAQNFLNPDRKYIENGKIVIVKNGKKFNAAGAQIK
ncbi:MAG: hypothetical protein IJ897_02220 [Prevotella sp.]|nr:hypothetical protein [Prevotella sp.]